MRFDTVLVANRGEIALRVIRACSAAGLRSVAVYSDADRDAPHVRAADTAVRIGPAAAAASYLSIAALLEAADRSGAGAIHPGYGFLSERAEFSAAVVDAGLVFVGPSADVMQQMGRKDLARQVAISAGVPVVPAATSMAGTDLNQVADEVGFPLLAKAAAGGGGKGMRIIRRAEDMVEAVASARREATSAFGDDTMLFERYVEHGRHIEAQILADEHGHVVHLFERDCSVQRRHQKVLEEAPAPTISAEVRQLVLSSAVELARRVGYVNAGTVEFLVSDDEVYFLEMNTRLQVEHPVTELVTGRDLVQLQLDVAQGFPLPFGQADLAVRGHAIEARVYAEDPYQGFLPQAGVADLVSWPSRVRVDAALESGQAVSSHYDPMLAKVIAFGATRESARLTLVDALDETAIVGLSTNVGFLRDLAGSAAFRDAEIDTAWLDSQQISRDPQGDVVWALASWSAASNSMAASGSGPFGIADGWRVAGPAAGVPVDLSLRSGDVPERRVLTVHRSAGRIVTEGRELSIRHIGASDDGWLVLAIDGVTVRALTSVDEHAITVVVRGQQYVFDKPDVFAPDHAHVVADGRITAPMPGTVLSVKVTAGQQVSAGDTLGVLEAMKMELSLAAPFDGFVGSVAVIAGAQVELGAELFVVDALATDEE